MVGFTLYKMYLCWWLASEGFLTDDALILYPVGITDKDETTSKNEGSGDALSSSTSSSSSDDDSGDEGETFISIRTRGMRQLPGGGCTAVSDSCASWP